MSPSDVRTFVSEPLEPTAGSFRTLASQAGEPAWPARFSWRGRSFEIVCFERTWKSTDAAHRGPGNAYLRRHWADVRTACGEHMRIYVERGGRAARWFLHSLRRD